MLLSFRKTLVSFMINLSVPFLNSFRKHQPWPYSLEEHRQMAPGTLGNDVAIFLDNRDLQFLPKYETHDICHVLLGYGTTPLDELNLQAFMLGNKASSFAGKVLLLAGCIILPEYISCLRAEYARGTNAQKLKDYPFTDLIKENTITLRTKLNV